MPCDFHWNYFGVTQMTACSNYDYHFEALPNPSQSTSTITHRA
ncbi:hypothetical protein [Ralstonia sp. 1B3]